MGVVYLGRDEPLDRDVAIKTLRVGHDGGSEVRGRFEIEARAAARLQHPNIVTVFELGEDRGLPFIAMELLGGADLEAVLRSNEKLSIGEKLDIVLQTLRGLEFAHDHRVIHRDIKPSNIRLLDDGSVKILDFGIAKVESASVTRAGMMIGTPYYMSPEQIRAQPLDGRSDLFSLGVMVYEIFAGARPFGGPDPTRVLFKIVNEEAPPLPANCAGELTPALQEIVNRALAKDAADRYAAAAEMAADVSKLRARVRNTQMAGEDRASLMAVRREIQESGGSPQTLRVVETLVKKYPDADEVLRVARSARRKPPEWSLHAHAEDTFPELDAAFATTVQAGAPTVAAQAAPLDVSLPLNQDTVLDSARARADATRDRGVLPFVAAGVLVASVLGALLWGRSQGARRESEPPSPVPTPTVARETPAALPAATTEPSPNVDSLPTVRPSAAPDMAPPLSTPQARAPQRATPTASPQARPERTEALTAPTVEPPNPAPIAQPATIVVESPYPVVVRVAGQTMFAGASGTFSVASGSRDISVEAPDVFLNLRQTAVLEAGGSQTISIPAPGKLNVIANPENCKVYVDGVYLDYVPIRDRSIASGSHTIGFEWSDGVRSETKVQVVPGRPAYATGRKP